MTAINQNKAVIFGAGRIGRSFIGQLFSRGGYEVVFIDVYTKIIDELNLRGSYRVIVKSDRDEILEIGPVRGVDGSNLQRAAHEVATAGIIAVSVGQQGLPGIFPALAAGLEERYKDEPDQALDIIIAENLRNASEYFQQELSKLLPPSYPAEKLIGLIETSIGRMVPIMLRKDIEEDILQVFAEPYNTLILDKKGFKNAIPAIDGLSAKENMKAWVDRKLFIHNLGHATAAYIGYLKHPDYTYLYELLADASVHHQTRETMLQSAQVLMALYPGEFTEVQLTDHIDDLLYRFQNKALGDTVFRVGSDLYRKLGPEDRLAGAIHSAIEMGLPYNHILNALVRGFHFRARDEHGEMLPRDVEFIEELKKGIVQVLEKVCGFDRNQHQSVFEDAEKINKLLFKDSHINT